MGPSERRNRCTDRVKKVRWSVVGKSEWALEKQRGVHGWQGAWHKPGWGAEVRMSQKRVWWGRGFTLGWQRQR